MVAKLLDIVAALFRSKEADAAVKDSQSMAELLGKLIPLAVGLLVAGSLGVNALSGKGPKGGR